MLLKSAIFILFVAASGVIALPLNSHNDAKGILAGTECNDIDEIVSNDPCQPFCTCTDGKVFCAELYCSRDNLPQGQNCRKVPTNGKCCPSYLCMTDSGVGELHYPLPQLFLPPELGLTGPYVAVPEPKNGKTDDRKSKLKSLII
ncbi:hypothetical protein BV898_14804 [Hypsibius exemplaris]|uniref:VWFC domain-containing protein n=1 Tax=Hypsibius exemplaris TaxID=2072580 RepID=A0A9X6N9G2_HYPEX|nr:hypothetical protein BV898_14804 [Hypsibius exemplaris]